MKKKKKNYNKIDLAYIIRDLEKLPQVVRQVGVNQSDIKALGFRNQIDFFTPPIYFEPPSYTPRE